MALQRGSAHQANRKTRGGIALKVYDKFWDEISKEDWPEAGELFVCRTRYPRLFPESWLVAVQGDGTCEGDTVHRGLFWTKEDALFFAGALEDGQEDEAGQEDEDGLEAVVIHQGHPTEADWREIGQMVREGYCAGYDVPPGIYWTHKSVVESQEPGEDWDVDEDLDVSALDGPEACEAPDLNGLNGEETRTFPGGGDIDVAAKWSKPRGDQS